MSEKKKTVTIANMKIAKDCMVTLEYTLKDENQNVLDSSEQMGPLDYIHGYKSLIPGLEKALEGREIHDSFSLTVPPKDGYGEIDQRAVFEADRSQFPPEAELEIGMEFEAGNHHVIVKAIDGDIITLDANHPLAGKTLLFDIKIMNVRKASQEEIDEILQSTAACGCGHDHEHDCCGCSGCH